MACWSAHFCCHFLTGKTISDLKQKAQNRPIRTVWMNPRRSRGFETGEYPAELDGPRYRWIFIRKVYTIIAIQLLVTVAVATAVVSVHSISNFIVHTKVGLAIYIAIILIPFIGTFAYQSHQFSSPSSLFAWRVYLMFRLNLSPKKQMQSCVHCITFTSYVHWIIFSLGFLPLLSDFWLDLHVRLSVVRDTSPSLLFDDLLMKRFGVNFWWLNLQLFDHWTIA